MLFHLLLLLSLLWINSVPNSTVLTPGEQQCSLEHSHRELLTSSGYCMYHVFFINQSVSSTQSVCAGPLCLVSFDSWSYKSISSDTYKVPHGVRSGIRTPTSTLAGHPSMAGAIEDATFAQMGQ